MLKPKGNFQNFGTIFKIPKKQKLFIKNLNIIDSKITRKLVVENNYLNNNFKLIIHEQKHQNHSRLAINWLGNLL